MRVKQTDMGIEQALMIVAHEAMPKMDLSRSTDKWTQHVDCKNNTTTGNSMINKAAHSMPL